MATRYSQPQSGARINWGNPLTRDILAAWNFASDYEPVTGTLATRGASNVSNVVSQYGKGIKVSGTSNLGRYVLNAPRSAVDIGAGDFTVFVSFVLDAAGGYCAIGRWNTGGTPATSDWMLGGASSGLGTDIGFTVAVGSSTYAASFVSGMPTSGLNTLVGRRVGTTIYVDRFLNGVFIQQASTTNAGITTVNYNAARSTKIGEIDVGAGYNVRMTAYNAATFRRFISDAELKTLVQNQWQIFQPTSRAIWVPVSAGSTGYTLTADQASYTLSGADATLTYTGSRTLTADSGAYSLTGNAATLAFNRNLAATQATYTLTGDAANLAFNRVLGADTVGYSLTGNTATLAFNRVLGADTVGYSLTGSAATLDYTPITGATYTLPAASTDFALTPSDAALIAARKVVADAYAAVLAGADATLTYTPAALPTIGRPASDTSNSGWTASTGTDLFAMVDEVTPDPLDYIVTTATGSVCELALEQTAYPGTASQALKYRASSSTGNSLIVRLKNGATTIRTETQALTATDTEYVITLTSGEIAAITSGSLSVELESA